MNDIFSDKNIYPHNGKITEHFKNSYEEVFVSFLPFYKLVNHKITPSAVTASEKITLEQAQQKNDLFKKLTSLNGAINESKNL